MIERIDVKNWVEKYICQPLTPKCLKVILPNDETVFRDTLGEFIEVVYANINKYHMDASTFKDVRVWYVWLDENEKVRKKTVAIISYTLSIWTPEKEFKDRKQII